MGEPSLITSASIGEDGSSTLTTPQATKPLNTLNGEITIKPFDLKLASIMSATNNEIETMTRHQFPGCMLVETEGEYVVLTVHGSGSTPREAYANCLESYHDMLRDGKCVAQIIGDIQDDLKLAPGMTRARHDSLIELVELGEKALNDGVLTHSVPWILVPSYTRQLEDLRRRITTRLNMSAVEQAQNEEAKKRAKQTFPKLPPRDMFEGMTPYQQYKAVQAYKKSQGR